MLSDKKIKDIYNISFDLTSIPLKERSEMHIWHERMLNKTYSELDLFDVTRMLIQKQHLEIAVSKALELLDKNPVCGQRYEGELLELLFQTESVFLCKEKDNIEMLLLKAEKQAEMYEWADEQSKKEWEELVSKFMEYLQ